MSSNKDDLFGGMFDFNGDGKTDLGEEFIAYKIFEEISKENDNVDDLSDDFLYDDFDDDFFTSPTEKPARNYNSDTLPGSTSQTRNIQPPKPIVPEHLTFKEYQTARKSFCGDVLLSVFIGLIICFFPVLVVWAAFKSYDPNNSASALVVTVFFLLGIIVIGAIIKAIASQLSPGWTRLQVLKGVYLKTATEEDLTAQKKKKRKIIIWLSSIMGAFITVLIVSSSIKYAHSASIYKQAELYIENGKYEQATEQLEQLKDEHFKDTDALISLCDAYLDYEKGRISDAYYTMKSLNFRFLSVEQEQRITDFKEILKTEYKNHIKEIAEKQQKKYESKSIR